jgi:hypothetical protein
MRPNSIFLCRIIGGGAVYGMIAYFGFAVVVALLMRLVRKVSPDEVKSGMAATTAAATASGS